MKGSKAFFPKYIVLLICAFALQAKAQIKHVIYIQTEDKKTFYVTLPNGQTKNSTESGYIILSQIADTLYPIIIGSSGNDFPEQKFVVDMNSSDWEFTFRKNANNEYELFDMVHSTVLNTYKEPVAQPAIVVTAPVPAQDSTQQGSLVKVEKDTAATKPQIVKDTAVTVLSAPAQDTALAAQSRPVMEEKQAELAVPTNKTQPNISKTGYYKINKIFERKSAQGIDVIYVDERKPKFDTIAIFIPAVQGAKENERLKKVAEPVKSKPVLVKPTPEQITTITPVVAAKQPCANVASNDDFLILRKQMASADNEEQMLVTAKNSFAEKCYSVAQIKNLSVLFLNEKNKFSFFQIARPATSDSKDFYKLINQLTQPDLIEKFAALIQQ